RVRLCRRFVAYGRYNSGRIRADRSLYRYLFGSAKRTGDGIYLYVRFGRTETGVAAQDAASGEDRGLRSHRAGGRLGHGGRADNDMSQNRKRLGVEWSEEVDWKLDLFRYHNHLGEGC